MEIAYGLVGLAVAVLAGVALSDRIRVPAPLLLLVAGAVVSVLPGVPEFQLNAQIVLLGLLPPLLYAASLNISLIDFHTHRASISLLSVVLVVITALAVGGVVHLVVPDVRWPVALALGAVVAPPDAIAATAIARRIGLPRRVVTILEGESLFNDATALVALGAAVAAIGGEVTWGGITVDFLVAAVGGFLVGAFVYVVVAWVRRHVEDEILDTGISLVTPFTAYLLAEEVHASGVLAVVVAGLLLGHRSPTLQNAQARMTERTIWRAVGFLLENAIFLVIGLQTWSIVDDIRGAQLGLARIVLLCLAVLVTVVVVRVAWLWLIRGAIITSEQRREDRRHRSALSLLIGWAGMRGVVTLAAAFVLPADTPHRPALLAVAFVVVAGTLLLQGTTLPLLARRLKVEGPDPAQDALDRATLMEQATEAGLGRMRELLPEDDPHGVEQQIRQRLETRASTAWEWLSTDDGRESPAQTYARLRREMLKTERARVLQSRSEGHAPADVVRDVLDLLDVEESLIVAAAPGDTPETRAAGRGADVCQHLRHYQQVEEPENPRCEECERDGTPWVALRMCLECGHVGCCDSSTGKHARAHFDATGHPVMQSAEPGETWRWCYEDQLSS